MKRSLKTNFLFLFVALLMTLNGCALSTIPNDLFSEGLLAIEKNSRFGYIDTKGNKVIDYYFDEAYAFNGKYAIIVRNNLYNIIDKKGITQLKDDADYLYFDNETGHLWFVKNNLLGLMKTNGDILIEAQYELSVPKVFSSSLESFTFFQEGLARVAKNGKLGYIDTKGKTIIEFTYDDSGHFSEGLAYFMSATEKYGYIDTKGKIVINANWDYAEDFNLHKQAIVANEDDNFNYIYALINQKGESIVGGLEDIEDHFDLYIIIKDDVCSIINTKGKIVNDGTYHDFSVVGNFIFLAVLDNDLAATKITIFNKNGKVYQDIEITQAITDELDDTFADDDNLYLFFVPASGKTVTLKLKNKTFSFETDDIRSVRNDFVIAIRNGEYGVRNLKDDLIIDYLYQWIMYFDDGYFWVKEDGLFGIINNKGKLITDIIYQSCNININSYNK